MTGKKSPLKPLPILKSDEEAERFVEEVDLTQYDLSQMKSARFVFSSKAAHSN